MQLVLLFKLPTESSQQLEDSRAEAVTGRDWHRGEGGCGARWPWRQAHRKLRTADWAYISTLGQVVGEHK